MGCRRYREVYSVNRKLIEYQDPQKSWSIDKISLEKWKKQMAKCAGGVAKLVTGTKAKRG